MPKDEETLKKVAKQIKVPYQDLEALKKEKKNFVWLRRQMTQTELNEMGSIKKWRNFLETVDEPKRIYPEKDVAAQLIGFVGADGSGLEGVEKIYNTRLTEKPTKVDARRDARGCVVIDTAVHRPDVTVRIPVLLMAWLVLLQLVTIQ